MEKSLKEVIMMLEDDMYIVTQYMEILEKYDKQMEMELLVPENLKWVIDSKEKREDTLKSMKHKINEILARIEGYVCIMGTMIRQGHPTLDEMRAIRYGITAISLRYKEENL